MAAIGATNSAVIRAWPHCAAWAWRRTARRK